MHVIRLGQAIPNWENPFCLRWDWSLTASTDTLYLLQIPSGKTTVLYWNEELIWSGHGRQEPKDLWSSITEPLLNYGIMCVPEHTVMSDIQLPDLEMP